MSILNFLIKTVEAGDGGTSSGRIEFNNPIGPNDIFELIAALLTAITRIGAAVVVVMVVYSGFLFVKAQGDPGELEKAKKTFMWTVIGGVILLGAEAIAILIQSTASELGVDLR